MSLNEDDIVTTGGKTGTEGPMDAGAGDRVDSAEADGGADGGADTEGPADAGAGQEPEPGEHDGGADGGA